MPVRNGFVLFAAMIDVSPQTHVDKSSADQVKFNITYEDMGCGAPTRGHRDRPVRTDERGGGIAAGGAVDPGDGLQRAVNCQDEDFERYETLFCLTSISRSI